MQSRPGEKIWIIGKGLSIKEYKEFPRPNIAINEAITIVKTPDYFISSDSEQYSKFNFAPETTVCVRKVWANCWQFKKKHIIQDSNHKYSLWLALSLVKELGYRVVGLIGFDSLEGNYNSIGNSNTSRYDEINEGLKNFDLEFWIEHPNGSSYKLLHS